MPASTLTQPTPSPSAASLRPSCSSTRATFPNSARRWAAEKSLEPAQRGLESRTVGDRWLAGEVAAKVGGGFSVQRVAPLRRLGDDRLGWRPGIAIAPH